MSKASVALLAVAFGVAPTLWGCSWKKYNLKCNTVVDFCKNVFSIFFFAKSFSKIDFQNVNISSKNRFPGKKNNLRSNSMLIQVKMRAPVIRWMATVPRLKQKFQRTQKIQFSEDKYLIFSLASIFVWFASKISTFWMLLDEISIDIKF